MDRLNLTDAAVRALPPAAKKQYIVLDAQLPGFRVIVGRRVKTYAVQVDVRTLGRRRTVYRTLGRADQLNAKAARAAARRLIGELQTGAAPAPAGRGPTLREAWVTYQAALTRRKRQPRTAEAYAQSLKLLDDWLDAPLVQISPELARARHAELAERSGHYAANRSLGLLRAIHRHATRGRGVEPITCLVEWCPEERRQSGMGSRDLPGWWAELRALPNEIRQAFHLLMLLSGSRPDALRRARWEHLDTKRRVLHFPDPKGGRRRAFDMPLSRPMLACLAQARRAGRLAYPEQAKVWIFPAATPRGCISETKERRTVLSKWGSDLRQTYRTLAVEAGIGDVDVQLLMNHKLPGVSGGYVTRGALTDHLRVQQERLSRFIVKALHCERRPYRR